MKNNIYEKIDLIPGGKIYFIGISGISMSGLAEIAMHLNFEVAGSDPRTSDQTTRLENLGVIINHKQIAQNIIDFDPRVVVYSSAIPDDNPELKVAREKSIINITRAQFLGWLSRRYENIINIAGTHGKSTTTAMISLIMMNSGLNPTVHLGAEFEYFDNNTIHLGSNNLFITEADEYKKSFHNFASTTSIILNIDADHLDFYCTIEDIIESFAIFANNLPENGNLIIPLEAENFEKFLDIYAHIRNNENKKIPNIYTYSEYRINSYKQANYYYKNLKFINGYGHFDLYKNDKLYGKFELKVPGIHNVTNAIAAVIAADLNGASSEAAVKALSNFNGAGGRFDLFGTFKGAKVIADYAHHPTEVDVTLKAAVELPHKKTWPVCQILNYSRAKDYHEEFLDLFKDFPFVIYYKIYSSRENDTLGQSAELLAEDFMRKYPDKYAIACNSVEELINIFKNKVSKDDMILFLGPEGIREDAKLFCQSEFGEFYKN